MIPVLPTSLPVGARLPMGLYTPEGVRLLPPGAVVNRAARRTLLGCGCVTLFLASSVREARRAAALHRAPHAVSTIDATTETQQPAAKTQASDDVTPWELDEGIRRWRRRVHQVRKDFQVTRTLWDSIPGAARKRDETAGTTPVQRGPWMEGGRLAGFRESRVAKTRGIIERLSAGRTVLAHEPRAIVEECAGIAASFPAQAAQLPLLTPRRVDDLVDHLYAVSTLAVCIAWRMGWRRTDVVTAGTAGLLCDVGMLLTPDRVREAPRPLSEMERALVQRHTLAGATILEAVEGLPEIVRRAVYEHHEREDGSGYPDRRSGPGLCDAARIVAVADAFAAATEPRPYRPRKQPHDAVVELIHLARDGVLCKDAVKGLVAAVGLFPIGGCVRLSNNRDALVVTANPDRPDRPCVRPMGVTTLGGVLMEDAIDLGGPGHEQLRIVAAIDAPEGVLRV